VHRLGAYCYPYRVQEVLILDLDCFFLDLDLRVSQGRRALVCFI